VIIGLEGVIVGFDTGYVVGFYGFERFGEEGA